VLNVLSPPITSQDKWGLLHHVADDQHKQLSQIYEIADLKVMA